MKFYDFLTKDNIIFFVIYGLIVLIAVLVSFMIFEIIVKFIIKLFRKLFNKEEPQKDQGADLNVVVRELEKSKQERVKTAGPKLDYINYPKEDAAKLEPEKSDMQKYDEKEQKDIASGLGKLKGEEASKTSFLNRQAGSDTDIAKKIEIPVSKKFGQEPEADDKASAGKLSSEAKIPAVEKSFDAAVSAAGIAGNQEKIDSAIGSSAGNKNEISVIKNKNIVSGKKKPETPDDNSIFGGKSEVSRMELRQKLRSSNVYQAQRGVGLNLSQIERAKLEKEVFSQSMGRNISKTDLKWGVKKLNQKMLGTKDPAEHAKIRKEIKFFKKIGGI